ncbi:cellulose synthase subunit BcsC-related outer membrane protein [Catenovulum sp. 2E275]|uniref:cellulose synthase subunit BcsC-related outer membrane protein n=1 Tax=Catenovulum sp. 2E275 TaxID=2980497 RepID=UPI0021D0C0EA|nr:cellulose synthase subunit BcsC-related outer membrane protein [Catenovulum sp. 2E275]MCU4677046.1 cellulose synthase subunit BcsC-related outer membrane protein [Catenovulum sp. 2E275]
MPITVALIGKTKCHWISLVCLLLSSFSILALPIDEHPSDWLTRQLQRALLQNDDALAQSVLVKFKQMAPNQPERLCAQIRYEVANNQLIKAHQIYTHLTQLSEEHHCQNQVQLLLKVNDQLKSKINQARLFAKIGQYAQAIKIYDEVFSEQFAGLSYQIEYLYWLQFTDTPTKKIEQSYQELIALYPDLAELSLPYADFLLKKNPPDTNGYLILQKYAPDQRYHLQTEDIWLRAISRLSTDINNRKWANLYINYFPESDKGRLVVNNFWQRLDNKQKQLSDPGYSAWLQAVTLSDNGEYKLAQNLLIKALKYHPKDAQIHASMALLQMRMGEHHTAQKHFNQALKLAPDAFDANTWRLLLSTTTYWGEIANVRQAINNIDPELAQGHLNKAIQLEPENINNEYFKGEIERLRGNFAQAKKHYQSVLSKQGDNALAQLGMLNLLEKSATISEGWHFYNSLSNEQKNQINTEFERVMANIYRQTAVVLLNNQQTELAIQTLNEGIEKLSTQTAWLSFDLADILVKQSPQAAEIVFTQQLPSALNYPDFVFSYALFLGSQNKFNQALKLIEHSQLSSASIDNLYTTYQQELKLQNLLLELKNTPPTEKGKTDKLSSTQINQLTQVQKLNLAQAYYTAGFTYNALDLVQHAASSFQNLPLEWQITYCQWLKASGYQAAYIKHFKQIKIEQNASEVDIANWGSLFLADLNNEIKPNPPMLEKLKLLQQSYPNFVTPEFLLSRYYLQKNQFDNAENILIKVNSRVPLPDDLKLDYLSQISTQNLTKKPDSQTKQFRNYLIASLTDNYQSLENYQQKQLLKLLQEYNINNKLMIAHTLVAQYPADYELKYWAAELASSTNKPDQAQLWYQDINQSADKNSWYWQNTLRQIEQFNIKNEAWVAVGLQTATQKSTNTGKSVSNSTVPIELWLPYKKGHFFTKLDVEQIQDPSLVLETNSGLSNFGTGLLCTENCIATNYHRQDTGTDIALGWQNESWRFDIGSSPMGFKLSNFLFGIRYQGDISNYSYSIEAERRALNDSVLAYSGLIDPYSGLTYGGVSATGISLTVSHDLGQKWGFWGLTDYYSYNGKNVKSNQSYSVMGGAYYRIIQNPDFEFSLGSNLLHWAYQYNLSGETFGHGGYYSPQSYYGISFPLELTGQWNRLSYQITLAASWSTAKDKTIEYFPSHPDLQTQAENLVEQTFVIPNYQNVENSGLGYRIQTSVEYKLNSQWIVGGVFSAQKANDYQPTNGQIYFRYYFGRSPSRLYIPPEPIKPYQNF